MIQIQIDISDDGNGQVSVDIARLVMSGKGNITGKESRIADGIEEIVSALLTHLERAWQ